MPNTGYFFVTDLVTDLEPAELEASNFLDNFYATAIKLSRYFFRLVLGFIKKKKRDYPDKNKVSTYF